MPRNFKVTLDYSTVESHLSNCYKLQHQIKGDNFATADELEHALADPFAYIDLVGLNAFQILLPMDCKVIDFEVGHFGKYFILFVEFNGSKESLESIRRDDNWTDENEVSE